MKEPIDNENWMTANQVAELKGVSRQSITKAIKANRLPARKWGRFWVIHRADAEKLEKIGHRPKKDTEKG